MNDPTIGLPGKSEPPRSSGSGSSVTVVGSGLRISGPPNLLPPLSSSIYHKKPYGSIPIEEVRARNDNRISLNRFFMDCEKEENGWSICWRTAIRVQYEDRPYYCTEHMT